MFKTLLVLTALSSTTAMAAYPEGSCGANETKLIFESMITVGTRVQLRNPMFCFNTEAFALLAGDNYDDYTSTLCGLYQMGYSVNAGRRPVIQEVLASFDGDSKFTGLMEYKSTKKTPYTAVTSITCETGT